MKGAFYTLLYIAAFFACFLGCASRATVGSRREQNLQSDTFSRQKQDSTYLQQLQQAQAAMCFRLQHISLSPPDSMGQQYIRDITYMQASDIKNESSSTVIEQRNQDNTQAGRLEATTVCEEMKKEKGAWWGSWWKYVLGVLFFVAAVRLCSTVVNQICCKIVSKYLQ